MKKSTLIDKISDVRSLIYTLLISSSLLFLLNLKDLTNDFTLYGLILIIMFGISACEFLFAIHYSAKVYHKNHPLHHIYKRLKKHHLFNIILLPMVQYISCALLIYFNVDTYINFFAIVLSSIMTYFTFFAYNDIYSHNLYIHHLIEEFFDASRYVSFGFLVYLFLLIQSKYSAPRFLIAAIIGGVQLIYIISALWRRNKLKNFSAFIALLISILLSIIVYFLLIVFNLQTTLLFMTLTAQILIIDYSLSSIFLKYIQKHLNVFAILEYIMIIMISISFLYFSK